MKCLIIAAGRGSRLRQRAESKPLVPVLGTPLIERVIRAARRGGADEFYVVSGYQGPRLRAHLDVIADRDAITIRHLINDRWQEPNGVSVLAARESLGEPFLLLMSDHLFDPEIVRGLCREARSHGLTLAVDRNIDNPHVDLSDVTRVLDRSGRIREIGKGIERYNCFDTGIFRCDPELFDALELSIARNGDASLSGGVRLLAQDGLAYTYDIGERYWLDVDDSRAFVKAEVAVIEGWDRRHPDAAAPVKTHIA